MYVSVSHLFTRRERERFKFSLVAKANTDLHENLVKTEYDNPH